jgi:hypothetical protein
VKLDKTINIGTVIHLVGVVITVVVLYSGVITRLSALETKVDAMWSWFAQKLGQTDAHPPGAP